MFKRVQATQPAGLAIATPTKADSCAASTPTTPSPFRFAGSTAQSVARCTPAPLKSILVRPVSFTAAEKEEWLRWAQFHVYSEVRVACSVGLGGVAFRLSDGSSDCYVVVLAENGAMYVRRKDVRRWVKHPWRLDATQDETARNASGKRSDTCRMLCARVSSKDMATKVAFLEVSEKLLEDLSVPGGQLSKSLHRLEAAL